MPFNRATVPMKLCPIIPDKKLAFVAIPKNAGTSIRVAFGVAQGFAAPDEVVKGSYTRPWPSVGSKQEIHALKAEGYLRFCVARDPWSRLVSCWKNKSRKLNWLRQNTDDFQANMPFLPFARAACSIPDERSDRHLRSQFTYVFDGDLLLVDRILRFETLEEDWEGLRKQYDLQALPHYKRSRSQFYCWDLYNQLPEARELVAKRYARDIEFFGYEFEDCRPPLIERWKWTLMRRAEEIKKRSRWRAV